MEREDVPFSVRNDVEILHAWLEKGARVGLPQCDGWYRSVFVYRSAVSIDSVRLGLSESVLVRSPDPVKVETAGEALRVAYVMNHRANVARAGTVRR